MSLEFVWKSWKIVEKHSGKLWGFSRNLFLIMQIALTNFLILVKRERGKKVKRFVILIALKKIILIFYGDNFSRFAISISLICTKWEYR